MAESAWAKAKVDTLFFHWVSSEHGSALIKSLVEDVRAGKPATASTASLESSSPQQLRRKISHVDTAAEITNGATGLSSPSSVDSVSPSGHRKYPQRKKSNLSNSSSLSSMPTTPTYAMLSPQSTSSSSLDGSKPLIAVPPFYNVSAQRHVRSSMSEDALDNRLAEIHEVFKDRPDGINSEDFLPICKNVLDFPSALNAPLFRRIRMLTMMWRGEPISSNVAEMESVKKEAEENPRIPTNPAWMSAAEQEQLIELETGRLTEADFLEWWKREAEPFDRDERFFRLVKQPGASFITAHDFFPFVRELIQGHPGLEFLENTPEFQEKYARTVVARIMHRVNTSWTGEVSLRELRKSDLLHWFGLADEEEEINAINEFFSYEHFYVIYCKFWELDSDHDFLLSREDLIRHGGHSLTKLIVDRIFQQPCRPFSSGVKNKMGFEDFCFFILCEEDKTNATSLRYWFHLVDLDGDGLLRQWEIRSFYDEQQKRMRSLGTEEVTLNDVLSQMKDCLGKITGRSILFDDFGSDSEVKTGENDDDSWAIGMREFLKPDRMAFSGSFFNLLFNLNKFMLSESKDPFQLRMQAEQPLTDWDRYALTEYARLASAEEARSNAQQNQQHQQQQSQMASQGFFETEGGDSDSGGDDSDQADSDDSDAEDRHGETSDSPRSSEDSGDFNVKGLSPTSIIFASNSNGPSYKRTFGEDEPNDRTQLGKNGLSEGALQKKAPLAYKFEVDKLYTAEARFNVGSLWFD